MAQDQPRQRRRGAPPPCRGEFFPPARRGRGKKRAQNGRLAILRVLRHPPALLTR